MRAQTPWLEKRTHTRKKKKKEMKVDEEGGGGQKKIEHSER